jgi:hypothetical protein
VLVEVEVEQVMVRVSVVQVVQVAPMEEVAEVVVARVEALAAPASVPTAHKALYTYRTYLPLQQRQARRLFQASLRAAWW